jgi:hypothetical protein
MGLVSGCFPRRGPRQTLREVTEAVRRRLTAFAVGLLAGDEAVLVVDETGKERSSAAAVGVARVLWRADAAMASTRGGPLPTGPHAKR